MATYKSAKKQLAWTMEVLEGELQAAKEDVDMYARLLDQAEAKGNQADIDFWFKSFSGASERERSLRSLYFMITHPDIHDENWK